MDIQTLILIVCVVISASLITAAASLSAKEVTYAVKLLLLFIALMIDIIGFASRYYLYLLAPLFTQRRRHVVISNEDPYWLSASQDAILRKEGESFVATVYITIPVYRSATEMSDEEKLSFSTQVSRMVGLVRNPARFTTELRVMNKDSYIQRLRDTINVAENEEVELQSKNASQGELSRVRGKLTMWRNMLESLSNSFSFELMSYVAVSADGAKEFEAVSIAQQRARELISGIGSIFGVQPNTVTGNEILRFVEPEFMIPISTVSEQISRGVEKEVI